MTETMPEETEDWGDVEASADAVTYPEYGPLPEARISLNFTPGKAPQLTVRAHTAAELTAALQELEEANVYNVIGVAHASMTAQASIGAGLGPATQVPAPAGPPAPPAPQGPPFGPNVSVPGAPGYQGPPAPPAPPAGANGQRNGPKPRPTDWAQVYKITVPRGDDSFKTYREQNQQYFKGKIRFAGNGQYWVAGDVAQSLATWNPVPA